MRILQITPAAPGWRAVYEFPEGTYSASHAIACWALVEVPYDEEHEAGHTVVGIISEEEFAKLGSAETCSNFAGYLEPGRELAAFAAVRSGDAAGDELHQRQDGDA